MSPFSILVLKTLPKVSTSIVTERTNLSSLGFKEQIPLDNSKGSIGTTRSAT